MWTTGVPGFWHTAMSCPEGQAFGLVSTEIVVLHAGRTSLSTCWAHVDLRFWTMTFFKKINTPSNDKLSTISPKHGWYKPSSFGSLVLGLPHHSCSSFQVMLRHVSAKCSCLICYQIPVIAAKSSAKAHHVVTAASSLLQITFGSRFSNTFGVQQWKKPLAPFVKSKVFRSQNPKETTLLYPSGARVNETQRTEVLQRMGNDVFFPCVFPMDFPHGFSYDIGG
jgi:hypothetical protein